MSKDKKIAGVSGTFTIDDTAQILPNDNIGWICPVCGRGLSPDTPYCPCRSAYIRIDWSDNKTAIPNLPLKTIIKY